MIVIVVKLDTLETQYKASLIKIHITSHTHPFITTHTYTLRDSLIGPMNSLNAGVQNATARQYRTEQLCAVNHLPLPRFLHILKI